MGRRAEGWQIRRRAAGGVYYLRASIGGRQVERSTGHRDRAKASKEASRIYADLVRRQRTSAPRPQRRGEQELERLIALWLAHRASSLDEKTRNTYEGYSSAHWIPFFGNLSGITTESCEDYLAARLKVVKARSVRKELSALRGFLRWARVDDVVVPSVGKNVLGTTYAKRRRSAAIELSPEEVAKLVKKLPVRAKRGGWPVRARFLVQYETSLRTELIEALSVPENYEKGSRVLRVSGEIDKARWARGLPLSEAARKALDEVCPRSGVIFGAHDHRAYVRQAARVLGARRAKLFCASHLRSARLTHWLEKTDNLPGVQYLAGHKHVSTTAGYVKPSARAARDVLSKAS